MEYRAVGSRCAVDLRSLKLPVTPKRALQILSALGFEIVEVDILAAARSLVGVAQYKRGAKPSEAPAVFDCSSFVKYLFGLRGIWLPRRSIQQLQCGQVVYLDDPQQAGDVIFISGRIDYYDDDPTQGVGHVGIATGEGTVIHAANRRVGVVESPLNQFVGSPEKFRGIRRIVPVSAEVITLNTPAEREVETADDVRWIVLQNI